MNDRDRTANQAVADTKIMQKVNAAHREAFLIKFPGQVEHCMRLTAERLQACLIKREGQDLGDPGTWIARAEELRNLAQALSYLHNIHKDL